MRAMRKARAGFTLVEMLVAAALTMFIVVLLAGAFQQGIDIFRTLRAQAVNADKLRMALDDLRQDLARPHFDTTGAPGQYLSEQRLDKLGWTPPSPPAPAPQFPGFFRIWQWIDPATGQYSLNEGSDADRIPSAITTQNILHFTVLQTGDRPGEYFRALAPPNFFAPAPPGLQGVDEIAAFSDQGTYVYAAKWAEVAYFLADSGRTTPGGLKLYSLRRRVRVIPHQPDLSTGLPRPPFDPNYPEISQNTDTGIGPTAQFNILSDLPNPMNRMGAQAGFPDGRYGFAGGTRRPFTWAEMANGQTVRGEDILLTDVLSFEVKATGTPYPGHPGPAANWPRPLTTDNVTVLNADYPFDDLPAQGLNTEFNNIGARVFDTWQYFPQNWNEVVPPPTIPQYLQPSAQQVPLRIRIKALQIRLRVWDMKTQQTRQTSLVQEM
jgi:type II secretory pathway pseudopilin PulG